MNKIILIKRDGNQVPFDETKVWVALTRAFLRDGQGQLRRRRKRALSSSQRVRIVEIVTQLVLEYLAMGVESVHSQQVHDRLVAILFTRRHFAVAQGFSVWRDARAQMLARAGDSFAWTSRAASAYPAVSNVGNGLASTAMQSLAAAYVAGGPS